jgi:Flp pilus assembly pilin Flp
MTLIKNNRGQGMTEYLVLLMLVAVSSIAVVASLGKSIRGKITEARKQIEKVSPDTSSANNLAGSGDQ